MTSWTWRYENADGSAVAVAPQDVPEGFGFQADAESWIGEEWQRLLAAGVEAVSLFEDERLVYGPMSLRVP